MMKDDDATTHPHPNGMTTFMATFRDVAQQFGELIAAGNYPAAFTLLTPEAQGGFKRCR